MQIAHAVEPYLGGSAEKSRMVKAVTPRQTNADDCGVYVLACAEAIAEQSIRGCSQIQIQEVLRQQVTASAVRGVRAKILDLIQTKIVEASI